MEYSVYSDFDMEQHKKTFINYLEVVIDENGKIMYAVPSHQEKLIKLACKKLNVTRDELNAMFQEECYFDFVKWLCKVSGACAAWNTYLESYKFTERQIETLKALKDNGLYQGEI